MDQLNAHHRAQAALAGVLAKVTEDQLDSPTPCPDWKVRDVVSHVIAGNFRVAGATPPATDGSAGSELSGLIEALAASADLAQATFAAPDGMTRMYKFSSGSRPGSEAVTARTRDVLTHAWDLAKATGQSTDLDPELSTEVLEASHQLVTPDRRGPGRSFGEEQPCDPGRPPADRMAAFLGRSVG